MKIAPKVVGTVGSCCPLRFHGLPIEKPIEFLSLPDQLRLITLNPGLRDKGILAEFEAVSTGRGMLELSCGGKVYKVPTVVFEERELFVAPVICCNFHIGWDPQAFDGKDFEVFKSWGAGRSGHAFKKARNLEKEIHALGLPITWLTDVTVAREIRQFILQWHEQFGDDYGLMPSSFCHNNAVNYNLQNTQEETTAFLRKHLEDLQQLFDFYTETIGIDQFVGSVGDQFTRAAYELGTKALWGVCWEIADCDTSIHHKGVPPEVYKPDRECMRRPARHPGSLWLYPWTAPALIPTCHCYPQGFSSFSTDVDDIGAVGIRDVQDDYYRLLLEDRARNMEDMDWVVCVIHQEDHDCHDLDGVRYLADLFAHLPEGSTLATLGEISEWLNWKYRPEMVRPRSLYTRDTMTCHSVVEWGRGFCQRPDDWPEDPDRYPDHVIYYDSELQVVFQEGRVDPVLFYDYAHTEPPKEPAPYEGSSWPPIEVEAVSLIIEGDNLVINATLKGKHGACRFAIPVWNPPEDVVNWVRAHRQTAEQSGWFLRDRCLLIWLELSASQSEIHKLVEPA